MRDAGPTAGSSPTAAGMYDYYLGGSANTTADQLAAERVLEMLPDIRDAAWANRGFLQRAVAWMARRGVRQFIDIGAGFPTQRSTHEVVQELAADGRVLYTDIDPVVVRRGRELLAGVRNVAALEADVRQPELLLQHPDTRRLIDFSEPVGLLLVAVMHFIPDHDDPVGLVRRYVDALPSGSYLALSAGTGDRQAERTVSDALEVYTNTPTPGFVRSRTEIERFFEGLEIVPPYDGADATVTYVGQWGAEDAATVDSDGSRWLYAAVARVP